jgi:hypothetical protein
MRIGGKVGLAVAARIRPQVAFREDPHFALQTGRRTAGKTRPSTLTKVPLQTTPGTVLETVRTVIRGMSI